MTKSDNDGEAVRRTVRDAMERLITGSPIRSDGKLTIKSLAVEAGVKRWVLTHQHTDLQREFRARCDRQGETPENQKQLVEKYESMKKQLKKYKSKVSDLTEETHRLSRAVQVLTLEKVQLLEQVEKQPDKIRHLR